MIETSNMHAKGLAFFALLLCISSSVGRPVQPLTQNRTILNGPRPNETGRFVYVAEASQETFYCRFCSNRSVTDSTYRNEQQGLCFDFYRSNFTEHLSPYEKTHKKYALCNVGEFPGCGVPHFNITGAEWNCTAAHHGPVHSVYSSCQLRCKQQQEVIAQIYCNESLVWHTDYRLETVCTGPSGPSVEKDNDDTKIKIIIGVSGVFGVLIFGAVIVCYCRRKKRSPSQQSSAESLQMQNLNTRQQNGLVGGVGVQGGGEESYSGGGGLSQMTCSNSFATIGPCSLASDDEQDNIDKADDEQDNIDKADDEQDKETEEQEQEEPEESDNLLPKKEKDKKASKDPSKSDKSGNSIKHKSEVPDVKVFHLNSGQNRHENLGASCRLQENAYSVPRGSTFYIVPSSPGGRSIVKFEVVRKGEGQPYRGQACPELGLDFFHTVENATNDDAGMFTWHITLQGGEHFQRDFTIFISAAEETALESLTEKTLPSTQVSPPPPVNDSVVENNVDFISGEKSAEAGGRPEPEGSEAEPQVQSTAKRPAGFPTPQASNFVQAGNKQTVQPVSNKSNDLNKPGGAGIDSDSLSHLNILSSSLSNSRQPSMGADVAGQGNGEVIQQNVLGSPGQDQIGCSENNVGAVGLRGEVLQSSEASGTLGGEHLGLSSFNSSVNPDAQLPHVQEHRSVNALSNISHLNPHSIDAPSYGREEPSGISREEPCVEHARAEQISSDFNNVIDEEEEVEGARIDDAAQQTYRKHPAGDTDDQCITYLRDVLNLRFLERLCYLADPRDLYGDLRSWFGFGKENGIEDAKLLAIEYHRRGFIVDGPMRCVMRDLGNRGKKVCDLVRYFINNNRLDIVDLTVNNCPDHEDCHYCKQMYQRQRS